MTEKVWVLFREAPASEFVGVFGSPNRAIVKAMEIEEVHGNITPDIFKDRLIDEYRVGTLNRIIAMEVE